MTHFLWLNDTLLRTEEAHIDPTDRGLLLSDGLFETIRITHGALPHFNRHMQRFITGCHTLRLPALNTDELHTACARLIHANQHHEGSLRITFTRGPAPRGIAPPTTPQPTLLITSAAAPHAPPDTLSVQISRYTRPPLSPLSAVKSLSYLPAIMARIEAQEAGFDDALMLCPQGTTLASGTAGNLIIEHNNSFYTPPLSSGALPGTSRGRLIDYGICQEKEINWNDYKESSGAWLISSLSIVNIIRNNNKISFNILRDALFLFIIYIN